jgi:ubiquinone/menaquinone biosynthesis C-methylase UbiE
MPAGSELFLDTRSLSTSHRRLASLLAPGMTVLDVGCGSGAITRGIAEAVSPGGMVLGIDVSAELIGHAIRGGEGANLTYEVADIHLLDRPASFDVASAARVLQWLSDPMPALRAMIDAVKPGGTVVVLDYDHTKLEWDPEPPAAVGRFYDAFLQWRAETGFDNELARHLPAMLRQAGLLEVSESDESEVATRGERDFATRVALWPNIIATRGHQLVGDGALREAERSRAEAEFRSWIETDAERQVLRLSAVVGTRPLG